MTDTPKEQAKDAADERTRKAAWMNDQLAARLAPAPQPGVAPAKDARPDDAFTSDENATRLRRTSKAASVKPTP